MNRLWLANYPCTILFYLPIIGSDHILNTSPLTKNSNKGFKFEAKRLLYDDFFNIVKDVWSLFVKGSPAY